MLFHNNRTCYFDTQKRITHPTSSAATTAVEKETCLLRSGCGFGAARANVFISWRVLVEESMRELSLRESQQMVAMERIVFLCQGIIIPPFSNEPGAKFSVEKCTLALIALVR